MRIALISDIHANLEALTEVLRHIETQKVDVIHSLGDVVGYGGQPAECLKLVMKNCDVKLMGNHEAAVLGSASTEHYNLAAKHSTEWTAARLSDNELVTITEFKLTHTFDDVFLVHASPVDPDQWHYVLDSAQAQMVFDKIDQTLCFFGHSHIPMIFTERPDALPRTKVGHTFDPFEEDRYLVNIGSVGQPRDGDTRACYTILNTEPCTVEYHRVTYDINKAQAKMGEVELPQVLIDRLAVGR